MVEQSYQDKSKCHIVIIFYKPQYFMQYGRSIQLGSFPTVWIHKVYLDDIRNSDINYREIQKFLCQLNKIIPFEIWPPPDVTTPWDTWPIQYQPYHKDILKAIQELQPWYCSQINLNKIRIQDEQKDKLEE
ncbi:hypothetical protein J1N35_013735 [Gossypium stocksii]|uniref:Uncharacterized protein n=1 Tax=Gossypium stocksii TaxID=47602 RepID=A0A9D4A8N0_9ROSI|nr:hypothetical protein J1N35_013735 [Gossypium stocksii]